MPADPPRPESHAAGSTHGAPHHLEGGRRAPALGHRDALEEPESRIDERGVERRDVRRRRPPGEPRLPPSASPGAGSPPAPPGPRPLPAPRRGAPVRPPSSRGGAAAGRCPRRSGKPDRASVPSTRSPPFGLGRSSTQNSSPAPKPPPRRSGAWRCRCKSAPRCPGCRRRARPARRARPGSGSARRRRGSPPEGRSRDRSLRRPLHPAADVPETPCSGLNSSRTSTPASARAAAAGRPARVRPVWFVTRPTRLPARSPAPSASSRSSPGRTAPVGERVRGGVPPPGPQESGSAAPRGPAAAPRRSAGSSQKGPVATGAGPPSRRDRGAVPAGCRSAGRATRPGPASPPAAGPPPRRR